MKNTIAAIATPFATGGISIIRISGKDAIAVADKIFKAKNGHSLSEKKGYTASYGVILSEDKELDQSIATVFHAPNSYTGEDIVEISCHGGIAITKEVLRLALKNGAELAEPGEFTKRAFLNGKLSLTQAESVADLISATGKQAVYAAKAQLDGALSKKIDRILNNLLTLAGHLSAWIDYPDEEIDEVSTNELMTGLTKEKEEIRLLLLSFDQGKLLREGINTIIVGKPNVGKSTLMNLLTGYQRSIVTNIAGTTRDIVEETVQLGELILRLSDTAGIRETEDQVEKIGVEIAKSKIETADLILAVFDSSTPFDPEDDALINEIEKSPTIIIVNKSDLENRLDMSYLTQKFSDIIKISAFQHDALQKIEEIVAKKIGLSQLDAGAGILFTERQRICAKTALAAVEEAIAALNDGITLDAVTISVEEAIAALMELSGKKVTEEVVNQVFSHFCVGK